MVIDYHKNDYSRFRPTGYPVRHREKVPFEPKLSLPLEYRRMLSEIRDLDRELDRFVLGDSDYSELVRDAYSDNIHWSVRIEGNDLPSEEVKRLTTRFTEGQVDEKNPGPVQEIINHLYSFFAKEVFGLPWDRDTITGLHAVLMKGVDDKVVPGEIRKKEVSVIGKDGTEFFIACPPSHIDTELDSLIQWLNGSPYDEIVTATLFFHEFESIHPFENGNGRTGRTLFQVLLQELGLKNCKLCKFEREMLSDSETYYDLLAFADATGVYTQLVMFVTESLLAAYRDAVSRFSEKDLIRDMDENSRTIVSRSREVESFTMKDACSWIPGLGAQSVRSRIDVLVDRGILEKTGATKGLRYRFKDPFREFRV